MPDRIRYLDRDHLPGPARLGASFDPPLVREMAAAIGASMRSTGIQQGLAPVLDVARDPRWGRTEETIGEDPYLVGSVGTAYVQGLQSAGVHATLKHFAGYSASRAARNHAPVAMGRREFADVLLPPFEMAVRLGGARSVMPAYTDVDGVPATADRRLLTSTLRQQLGFDGVVVSDYAAISLLQTAPAVAAAPADAAVLALDAGVDVELPTLRCFGPALADAVRDGRLPAELVDRAARRVLRQKCDLGMLDPGWSVAAARLADDAAGAGAAAGIDLDPPAHRALARRLAEESVILLANPRDLLPLRPGGTVAVIGPLASDPLAFFGCYSLPRHLGDRHPDAAGGVPVTPFLDALRAESRSPRSSTRCALNWPGRPFPSHADAASAPMAVRGSPRRWRSRKPRISPWSCWGTRLDCSGGARRAKAVTWPTSGCRAFRTTCCVPLSIPAHRLSSSWSPGAPAIGGVADRLGAVVQAFFPGEEGGAAIAGVLTGRVTPSGKLPIEMPGSPGGQPSSYLRSRLAARHSGSSVDPTPLFAFGHGLSYTRFEYADLVITDTTPSKAADSGKADGHIAIPADGSVEIACTVRNAGRRSGDEIVQLYLSDPVAQVVRPVHWLAGFARVPLEPGQQCQVIFRIHADRTAFHGRDGHLLVEPGEIGVAVGGASDNLPLRGSFWLHGPARAVGSERVLDTPVEKRV